MGVIGDLFNKFRNNDEEEYYLDDEYIDDDEYMDDYDEPAPSKSGGLFSKKAAAPQAEKQDLKTSLFSRKVVNMHEDEAEDRVEVTMKRPKDLDDARDICDDLLDGKSVVINLEGINTDAGQRITDFMCGAVYSMDGNLSTISRSIFMATPHNVSLSGEFAGKETPKDSDIRPNAQPQLQPSRKASGFSFNV